MLCELQNDTFVIFTVKNWTATTGEEEDLRPGVHNIRPRMWPASPAVE